MRPVLFVAAEEREFSGMRYQAVSPSPLFLATSEAGVLAASGPGPDWAADAALRGLVFSEPEVIVSTGFCGALAPNLEAGQIWSAREIVKGETGERWSCHVAHDIPSGRLLSIDRVVQRTADRKYWADQGYDAVEMESAAVAQAAAGRSIPFFAVRVVSDAADEDWTIDFNRARGADGRFSIPSILMQAGRRPLSGFAALMRLRSVSRRCAERLGGFLSGYDFLRRS
jgi:adenosylhomocysteine nucleosidase